MNRTVLFAALLYIRDRRFTDHVLLLDPAGDDASRFRRSL
jgi:hypothetical protein